MDRSKCCTSTDHTPQCQCEQTARYSADRMLRESSQLLNWNSRIESEPHNVRTSESHYQMKAIVCTNTPSTVTDIEVMCISFITDLGLWHTVHTVYSTYTYNCTQHMFHELIVYIHLHIQTHTQYTHSTHTVHTQHTHSPHTDSVHSSSTRKNTCNNTVFLLMTTVN